MHYSDLIEQISHLLCKTIVEQEPNLEEKFNQLDGDLFSLLRAIGLKVMSKLLALIIEGVTNQEKQPGFVVHRRDYSLRMKRALTEFGIEESFDGAAQRFQEHYEFEVEPNSLRREVKAIAQGGEQYIEHRLARLKVKHKSDKFPGCPRLLVELDGSMVRTGVNYPADKKELTPKRKLQKQKRQIDWREIRVGFARQVTNKEQRTFMALMDKYPAVVEQLVSAAIDQGMGEETEVTAVADGGNGLREALEVGFPNLKFILAHRRCAYGDRVHPFTADLSSSRYYWIDGT